jgi:hypothetical protein
MGKTTRGVLYCKVQLCFIAWQLFKARRAHYTSLRRQAYMITKKFREERMREKKKKVGR